MNWFDKIKLKTSKEDNSPELKRGQIKDILLVKMNEKVPDFQFLEYKNSCYTFERIREANGRNVYEHLHIIFMLKDRNFSGSIASRLNQENMRSGSYNTGLINPHLDLIKMKKKPGPIPIEEAYYYHNGRVETTSKIVKQIVKDFVKYGLPFFEKQLQRLRKNKLVHEGLDFIENLGVDKDTLKSEIDRDLASSAYSLSGIKSKTYLELKAKLQEVPGMDRRLRKEIPSLAFELLELYLDQ